MGTAGGLVYFKEKFEGPNTRSLIVLHSDICCTFPLKEILEFHRGHGQIATIMGTTVPNDIAKNFGCYVAGNTRYNLSIFEIEKLFVTDIPRL
jgi:mannose-1-phosphate guanylyltransferase